MGNSKVFDTVILTAGSSTRMGYDKAFAKVGETSLLEICLNRYSEAGVRRMGVVCNNLLLGNNDFQLILRNYMHTVTTVNEFPDRGRNSSIRCGLETLSLDAPVFIQNIDNLPPSVSEIKDLLHALPSATTCVVPNIQGRNGHPVLIGADVAKKFIESSDESSFRTFLTGYTRRLFSINNPLLLYNINTPLALEELTKKGLYP